MTSFDFLDQQPEDLERFLLHRARADIAPAGSREKALARVGVAMGAAGVGLTVTSIGHGAVGASLGKASAVTPLLVTAKWVAVGMTAGALALGAEQGVKYATHADERLAVVSTSNGAPRPAAPRSHENPAPVVEQQLDLPQSLPSILPIDDPSPLPPLEPRLAPQPEPPSKTAPPAQPSRPLRPTVESTSPVGEPAAHPSLPSTDPSSDRSSAVRASQLPRELSLLDDARRAIADESASMAVATLDAYEREFPRGSLRVEADALRVEALVQLGQRDVARTLAQRFISTYPQSPSAVRVRALIKVLDGEARSP